jgi:hypothetical protein
MFRYYRAALVYLLLMKQKEGHRQSEEIDFVISAIKSLRPAKSKFGEKNILSTC